MNNKLKISLIVVIIVVLVIAIVQSSKQSNSQIKIGAVIPLTGTGAFWGEPAQNGIFLAQDTINKKYGPNAVNILIEDGKSVPPESVTAAQKLLSVDKVDAVYTELSGPSGAVAPVVKNANKIYYYSAFNPSIISQNDNSIKGFLSFYDPCDVFGRYLQRMDIKKVAIFNQFAGVAPSCLAALDKYISKDNILLFENLPKDNDYRSILLEIKNFGAGAVIGMTYEGPSLAWIRQMHDLGIKIPVFSGVEASLTQKNIDTIGADKLAGSLYFTPKINQSFIELYNQKYPNRPGSDLEPAAYAYEAMVNLAEAMVTCKSNVACTVQSFRNRNSDAGAISDTKYIDRVLTSTLNYYLINSGTSTPFNI
jgi:ABC-type branched-subunit amino acid transport system substrate-binding protein